MNIPSWPQSDEREIVLLREVLESPQWGGFHPFVRQFETLFARYQHAAEGVGACNGTLTLELALDVLGIGPGDEVIIPAISFISTATAVSRLGAKPVFVDIEPWSFNLDAAVLRAALSSRTRAVIAVHFGGALCRIKEVRAFCQEHNLQLIEDAAHAQGSEWNGQRAGSFGITGSFSFQNGKVLCAGEGGMLVASDPEFIEKARSISNQGRLGGGSFYAHHRLGTNFRMTGFQAAVLLAQLERLPKQIERRTRNVQRLKSLVSREDIVWQSIPDAVTQNSWYLLLARVHGGRPFRDGLCQTLASAGVPSTPFYPHTLYQNALYQQVDSCRVLPCPHAEACLEDAFWLPHRVLLSDDETIAAIAAILNAYRTR